MTQGIDAPGGFNPFDSHHSDQKTLHLTLLAGGALASSLLAGAWMLSLRPEPIQSYSETPSVASTPTADPTPYGSMVGIRPHAAPVSVAQISPAESGVETSAASNSEPTSQSPSARVPEPENARPALAQPIPRVSDAAPLPPPRPAEFGFPLGRSPFQPPAGRLAQQSRSPAQPAPPPADSRSFFEKIFGALQPSSGPKSSGPALAYASPETGAPGNTRNLTSAPMIRDQGTAVYDISAHTVYLPNGTKLEAHSGLGSRLDDPRYVNERMRGATPPNLYELSPREQLFHGVQALRLTPVGNGSVYGRAGLLAHSYMLGPKGDSNGCVAFRNYEAFLQAYRNGEVKRLYVVAHVD